MFSFGAGEGGRFLLASIGALLLSTPVVGIAVAPVEGVEACLLVVTDVDGQQLVCSHA